MDSILKRGRMYYRRYGVLGSLRKALADPAKVQALFAGPQHFYPLELSVHYGDVITFVRPLVDESDEAIERAWRESRDNNSFRRELEVRLRQTEERPTTLHSNWRELVYTIVRLRQPAIVVETGVFDGLSSAYILAALNRNDHGKLISIDLPDTGRMPSDIDGAKPGWLVPERYHSHWERRFGDAREQLPAVVDEYDLDIFLHDSLHTEDHIRFELRTAVTAMMPGSVIIADNVRHNDAFREFAAVHLESSVYWKNTMYSLDPDDQEVDDRLGAGLVATQE